MAVSERLGGQPSLTAALVIMTAIIGAVMVTPLMNAIGTRDYAARGFAAGLAAHGIGTARAFSVDTVAGTFAGIAMGLDAVVTAVLAPIRLKLMRRRAGSLPAGPAAACDARRTMRRRPTGCSSCGTVLL
jgi:putative effector of murein hydrolase